MAEEPTPREDAPPLDAKAALKRKNYIMLALLLGLFALLYAMSFIRVGQTLGQ